jgi:hypothetical protein
MEGLAFIHLGILGSSTSDLTDLVRPVDRLHGYRHLYSGASVTASGYASDAKPLWMAWQTPRLDGAVRASVNTLERALRQQLPVGVEPQVQFLICREAREDVYRGRCKITFPVDQVDAIGTSAQNDDDARRALADRLGRVCAEVERDWRSQLRRALRTPWVETEVVWRERWIGRLQSFLAHR